MDHLPESLQRLLHETAAIWVAGGWAMWPIAGTAFVLFAIGTGVALALTGKGFGSVPESTWRRWIDHPGERHGPIGALLDRVVARELPSDASIVRSFDQIRIDETVPFERDMRVMKVAVGAAPLFGLLGTVTGMLTTFGALASGSGGDQTMGMIAAGISEALITTETGLVVALPGLFFQYAIARRMQRYKAFLAHLETVCTQTVHRRRALRMQRLLRKEAKQRVARTILERLREVRGAS